jgi:hypothetical protein
VGTGVLGDHGHRCGRDEESRETPANGGVRAHVRLLVGDAGKLFAVGCRDVRMSIHGHDGPASRIGAAAGPSWLIRRIEP